MSNTQGAIDRVCEYRDLPPLRKGQQCEVNGKRGLIWGGNKHCNLNVLIDGKIKNCHPYHNMRIFGVNEGSGRVIYDSADRG